MGIWISIGIWILTFGLDVNKRAYKVQSKSGNSKRRLFSGEGFTLFEILVTFTLIALMIGVTSFMLRPNLEKYRIRKFLSTFRHELTIAHGLALQTGERTLFYIDPETRSFWADNRKRHNIPQEIEVRGENLKISVGEKTTVVFYPDGSCSGGILFLRWGEKLWECVLNPATGGSMMRQASS